MTGAPAPFISLESTIPLPPEKDASPDRAIWRGMLAVAAFVMLAKLAAAAKEVVVAWRFGVGSTTDAYMFLYTLVNWPVGVWTSILPVLVLPLIAGLRERQSPDTVVFQAELLGLTLLIGIVLLATAWVGLPWLVGTAVSGLPSETVAIAKELVPAMGWCLPFGMVAAVYATWTMSEGRHLNSLSEGLPALGILVAVALAGSAAAWAWGTVAGMAGQVVLLWLALGAQGRVWPAFRLSSDQWGFFSRGFLIMLLAQLLMSCTAVADQFFAARLGEGAVSVLGYANRILSLGLTLGATAVTRATLPIFSRLSSSAGTGRLPDDVVRRWTLRVWVGGAMAAAAGWVIAPSVVATLFERGQFTAMHTTEVTEVFRYGLLQVPFYAAALVLVSASASRGRYHVLFATGAVGLGVKLLGNFALVDAMSVNALMVSSAAVQALNCGILWWARKESRE